jgi:hypothetical protein
MPAKAGIQWPERKRTEAGAAPFTPAMTGSYASKDDDNRGAEMQAGERVARLSIEPIDVAPKP